MNSVFDGFAADPTCMNRPKRWRCVFTIGVASSSCSRESKATKSVA